MTERAGLVPIKQQHSDKHWLFQSHLIAVFFFYGILALSGAPRQLSQGERL